MYLFRLSVNILVIVIQQLLLKFIVTSYPIHKSESPMR